MTDALAADDLAPETAEGLDGLVMVRCTACRFGILAEPDHRAARLWHYGDGSHRLIAPEGLGLGVDASPTRLRTRAALLAVLVRLRDVTADLEVVLGSLEEEP